MELNEFQRLARRTQNHDINAHERLMHALFGLGSETGEVLGCYQKVYQGHALDKNKVIDELSDVLWFAAALADVLGVSLNDVAQHNIDKLRERYPEGFDPDKSINRTI